jgi:hypothetical protein
MTNIYRFKGGSYGLSEYVILEFDEVMKTGREIAQNN